MYTPAAQESDLQALREWLENERPLAVGEIGLDYFVPGLDRERQQFFFIEQLKLAREFNLPVLLHGVGQSTCAQGVAPDPGAGRYRPYLQRRRRPRYSLAWASKSWALAVP